MHDLVRTKLPTFRLVKAESQNSQSLSEFAFQLFDSDDSRTWCTRPEAAGMLMDYLSPKESSQITDYSRRHLYTLNDMHSRNPNHRSQMRDAESDNGEDDSDVEARSSAPKLPF